MADTTTDSRRSFIKKTALAASALASAGTVSAQETGKRKFKRKSPSSVELMEIGVLTATGGHVDAIWGPLINPTDGRSRVTGMVMTQAWDSNTEALDRFCQKYDVRKVKNYDDMVGKVDAVILSDFASLFWFHDLARPYLEAGIPMFINRPFTSSLKNARDIIETAKKGGAPIMCGSSLEYVQAVDSVRQALPDMGEIAGYVADNAQSDYATHGVHGIYFVYACIGGGVQSVSYQADDWTHPNGAMTFKYKGRNGGNNFWGLLQQSYRSGSAWIRVSGRGTTKRHDGYANDVTFDRQMDWPRESRGFVTDSAIWLPMIHTMERMFETGKMPEPYENIYEKTQMFIGGFYSLLEKNGAPVALDDIPLAWEIPKNRPPMDPNRYPKDFFK
ncbi:MAG: Gfo/Idh/MocA family oxidoreductase [Candidatus Latescibacterota bacterium]